jgi:hypothetical protein
MDAQNPVRRSPLESSVGKETETRPKITTIGSGASANNGASIEACWKRPPSKEARGATHVRTFTGKMNAAGLEHLDRHINEWLDNHPDAEVKFSTISSGEMGTSIGKESVVVVQVWI